MTQVQEILEWESLLVATRQVIAALDAEASLPAGCAHTQHSLKV